MSPTRLKLKQASAVLGVDPKDLQNFVQFRVLRPARRHNTFWFDENLLIQAKVAFFLKSALRASTECLAQITKALSRIDLSDSVWDTLLITSTPTKGRATAEIKIPLKALKQELQDALPIIDLVQDRPRGRKRTEWKAEITDTLAQAGNDMGGVSEKQLLKKLREYRDERRKKLPEIQLVAQTEKTA